MATLHVPRPTPRVSDVTEWIREAFWVIALGVIACYAFFVALGAFSPGDVAGVSIFVGLLLVLWLIHAVLPRRHGHERDPRLTSARERRGF
jgi:membrane protein implicated in regulation of membrane protease activity